MTTVIAYHTALRNWTVNVAGPYLGVDFRYTSVETRALMTVMFALLGVVIKVIVDKGLATDAEFQAALNAAATEPWPPTPLQPPTQG
jgi:hypothetical protein